MQDQVLLLKSLADPTRVKILVLIRDEELCVCELQAILQISQPAVSQHLAKLRAAGLVQERRAGMWTYYRANVQRLAAGLEQVLALLTGKPGESNTDEVPGLAELMERRAGLDRTALCTITRERRSRAGEGRE